MCVPFCLLGILDLRWGSDEDRRHQQDWWHHQEPSGTQQTGQNPQETQDRERVSSKSKVWKQVDQRILETLFFCLLPQGADAVFVRGPFPHRQRNPRPYWSPDQRTHVGGSGSPLSPRRWALIYARVALVWTRPLKKKKKTCPLSVVRETNSMVEEFMLLANISVAQKIYDEFPDCAMLRKHPAPPPSNYDVLQKAAKSKVRGLGWQEG